MYISGALGARPLGYKFWPCFSRALSYVPEVKHCLSPMGLNCVLKVKYMIKYFPGPGTYGLILQ